MKVYRIEICVIDFDEIGIVNIKDVIENTKYPNHCISPKIMKIEERDISEWDDDHPLNHKDQKEDYYNKLFS